jgi:electron transfer flavoprotein alpha/beta subunit
MKAKQKPLQELDLKTLGLDPATVGVTGAKLKLVKLMSPPTRTAGKILEGPPSQAVKDLVRLLQEEAKIL